MLVRILGGGLGTAKQTSCPLKCHDGRTTEKYNAGLVEVRITNDRALIALKSVKLADGEKSPSQKLAQEGIVIEMWNVRRLYVEKSKS